MTFRSLLNPASGWSVEGGTTGLTLKALGGGYYTALPITNTFHRVSQQHCPEITNEEFFFPSVAFGNRDQEKHHKCKHFLSFSKTSNVKTPIGSKCALYC